MPSAFASPFLAPPSPLCIWQLLLALMAAGTFCSSLALFPPPTHQILIGAGGGDELEDGAMNSRTVRSFAQSFPYSTLAYYRNLKPMLLNRYRAAQQKFDQQQQEQQRELERKWEQGRELAGMLAELDISGQNDGAAERKRRSDSGAVLKRYACRFKFCRIFSPNE